MYVCTVDHDFFRVCTSTPCEETFKSASLYEGSANLKKNGHFSDSVAVLQRFYKNRDCTF